ncbi:hypothetical protein [Nocardioides sp. SYSU D00038]|uniref:hypothetical protein n=1 Tax=Nocardioides sp. SYSU D00038 TaxID=2812554 RepID=UPI0019684F38|nr:hypothetical protein [Nocardioides sp. SYSU D00038]
MTTTSKAEDVQQAASTAKDEATSVAQDAASEARALAGEATEQAKQVASDALGQVNEQLADQARQQRDRVAQTLTSVSDELAAMAGQGQQGLVTDLARQAAERARSLGTHLEQHEPGQLLDDVRRFARERPGTFLLGALAAGVLAGRLLRSTGDSVAAAGSMPSTGTATGSATGTATGTGTGTATTGLPTQQSDPAPVAGSSGPGTPTSPVTAPLPQTPPGQPTQDPAGSQGSSSTGPSVGGQP